MTPAERKRLAAIGTLVGVARDAEYAELRPSALYEAYKAIKAMLKPKPWRPRAGRYYLVDAALGNGAEITPAELTRLIRLLEAAIRTHWTDSRKGMAEDGELLEKLRGL